LLSGLGGLALDATISVVLQEKGKESSFSGDQRDIATTMIEILKKLISDEEGQDLVEYALLLVFLALAAIAVLPTLGSAVNNVFSQSASTLGGS
jgi:pilus assembly protein Flp/PilA